MFTEYSVDHEEITKKNNGLVTQRIKRDLFLTQIVSRTDPDSTWIDYEVESCCGCGGKKKERDGPPKESTQ